MNPAAFRPAPRRPYWALLALVALLLLPSGTADAVLTGALVVASAVLLRAAAGAGRRHTAAAQNESAVVLGSDSAGAPVVLADRQLSAHGLILGASGAGKSTTLLAILVDHIRRGRPVVAIDMKGSPAFAQTLAHAAAAAGREFRMWTPEGPARWNPLQHGNATELKDKLISTERFTEPHYQRAAERYVQLALQARQEADRGRAPTLAGVVSLLEPQRLAALVRQLPGERAAHIEEYLAGLTPDQLSAVRGLGTRLAIISESHTGAFLEPASAALDALGAPAGFERGGSSAAFGRRGSSDALDCGGSSDALDCGGSSAAVGARTRSTAVGARTRSAARAAQSTSRPRSKAAKWCCSASTQASTGSSQHNWERWPSRTL